MDKATHAYRLIASNCLNLQLQRRISIIRFGVAGVPTHLRTTIHLKLPKAQPPTDSPEDYNSKRQQQQQHPSNYHARTPKHVAETDSQYLPRPPAAYVVGMMT